MVKITLKDLEIELKKRGLEQYLDFLVMELKKGEKIKDVLKEISRMDAEVFIKDLQNPKKLYLPTSYHHGESEVNISGKEKIEGYLDVNGEAEIIPKCRQNQIPYQKGSVLACIDDKEELEE